MSLTIAILVLFAALLHASWNALLKSGGDGFWSMTVMGVATALACAIAVCRSCRCPARASWPYIADLGAAAYRLQRLSGPRLSQRRFRQRLPDRARLLAVAGQLGAALVAGEHAQACGTGRHRCWSAAASSRWPFAGGGCRRAASSMRWAPASSSPPTASPTASAGGCPATPSPIRSGCACCGAPPRCRSIWLCGATASCGAARARPGWRRSGGVISVIAYGIVIFAMTQRAHGLGFGLAGNQRAVRGAAGADILRRKTDGAADRSALVIAAGAICLE